MKFNLRRYFLSGATKSLFLCLWVLGLMLTVIATYWVKDNNDIQLKQRTDTLMDEAVRLTKKRFELYEYAVLGTRGAILVAGSEQITRAKFKRYISSSNAIAEFPGARGFGFIRRVPMSQELDFINSAQADDAPNFNISAFTPHQDDRYVIQYILPEDTNQAAIGLDIASEVNRKTAAINATLNNKATLTAPITLVQADNKSRFGFLVLLPIYDPLLGQNTPTERLEAAVGWSYAALMVDEVLFDLGPILREISLSIFDGTDEYPFFETPQGDVEVNQSSTVKLEVMGRQWHLDAQPKPEMFAVLGLWSPSTIFIVSIVVLSICLLLLYLYFISLARSTNQEKIGQTISIASYTTSPTFKKLTLLYILLMIGVAGIKGYFSLQQAFQNVALNLASDVELSKQLIKEYHRNLQEDVVFLKSTPPVIAMISGSATNPSDVLSNDAEYARLAEIFRSYMVASPNVYQLRLISAQDGNELVRVSRIGNSLITASSSQLQSKNHRSYYAEGLALEQSEIFVSDINPIIENGVIETPIRPTVRYVGNIKRDDASVFGLLVMNVDAQSLFENIATKNNDTKFIYATNPQSEFLLSDNSSQTYGSWLGKPLTWDDVFVRISSPLAPIGGVSTWKGRRGSVWSVEGTINPNNDNNIGQINIIATYLTSSIYKNIVSDLLRLLFISITIFIFSVFIFYYVWSNHKRILASEHIKQRFDDQRRKEFMFESLTELSPEAMIFTDTQGMIMLVNSQAERLFGYTREQMLNSNISMLLPDNMAYQHDLHIKHYVNNPVSRAMGGGRDLFSRYSDGTEFPVEVSLSPIQLDDQLLIASSIRDVSQRKNTEQRLNELINEAQRANKAKSTFLANMSHEIRTPLNAVIGLSHLLKDDNLLPQQLNLVNKIQLAGRSLLGIVNDILDLAKVEANEMTVNETPCNLKEILTDLHSIFADQAATKNLKLKLELDENIPTWVITDGALLRQILTNLLGNAIKFTSKGKVSLCAYCVECEGLSDSQQMVCFTVKDTGIGISQKEQEKIFEPFNQANDTTTRQFGGTGLGLSIVNNLSVLLGGEVGLESELEQGSNFWIKLPMQITNIDEDIYHDNAVRALNVWIIGHESSHKNKLKTASQALGWHINSFNSAAAMIQKANDNLEKRLRLPDVLLIDWEMPEIDGLAALKKLFTTLGHKVSPAVLVISLAQSTRLDSREASELVDSMLIKPAGTSELFNAVNNAVANHTGNNERVIESTKIEAVKAKWLPNVRILVVDDSEINLEVVASILTRNGALVTTANSGKKALDYLAENASKVDAVLMDIEMPEMDGLEALRHIRQELKLKKLPVIALTAGTMEEERKRAMAAGMDHFLTKPIEPASLIHTLRKIVENYRGNAIMIESLQSRISSTVNSDWPVIHGLKSSAELFQGDKTLFTFTLQGLLKEHISLETICVNTLPNLKSKAERLVLAARIHKLRGSAGMIGATKLYKLASDTEIRLRKGHYDVLDLLEGVSKALTALRHNSASFLESQAEMRQQESRLVSAKSSVITTPKLQALIEKLDNNDLSASAMLREYGPNIRELLGHKTYDDLHAMIQQLDYENASELLTLYLNKTCLE